MSDVPMSDDVLISILSRLPAKTILQFRSVSKQWLNLIDDPIFIQSHLKHSISSNSNQTLILSRDNLHSVELDSLNYATPLNHPFTHVDNPLITVLGSSNGILCLYTLCSNPRNTIVFLNPTTRNLHQANFLAGIQRNGIDIQDSQSEFYCYGFILGFGYDRVNDDYKVIRFGQLLWKNGDSTPSDIEIYSLKSNSWRRIIRHVPYFFPTMEHCDTLVSGALHWVVRRKCLNDKVHFIAAFDLGTEEFRLVPQPDFLNQYFNPNVAVLGGCLSVSGAFDENFDIWVMKSYGLKESWTKLVSIARPVGFHSFKSLRALTYSKTGGKLLLQEDGNEFVWYDLGNETLEKVEVRGLPRRFNVNICLESLVQINGSNGN